MARVSAMAGDKPTHPIYVGCAGWTLSKAHAADFPITGTHLARYAARLPAVEINSSFYRPHKPATYAKWAEAVPTDFRFSVKVPREATHNRRLVDTEALLDRFLAEAGLLVEKLGPLLVQLAPSLRFSTPIADKFFAAVRQRFAGEVVLEPRHASWFTSEVEQLMKQYRLARVAADPAVVTGAAEPGGWHELVYYRLHGAPRIYYSNYDDAYLHTLADKLRAAARSATVWCIFDNTAEGAATANALAVLGLLQPV